MSVASILAMLQIAKSDETALPEDGRYFSPGALVLCVSRDLFFFCLSDVKDNTDMQFLSNVALSLAQKVAST
jgi:hypothetical protein